jgi:hypothetical protein
VLGFSIANWLKEQGMGLDSAGQTITNYKFLGTEWIQGWPRTGSEQRLGKASASLRARTASRSRQTGGYFTNSASCPATTLVQH